MSVGNLQECLESTSPSSDSLGREIDRIPSPWVTVFRVHEWARGQGRKSLRQCRRAVGAAEFLHQDLSLGQGLRYVSCSRST